ncbi:tRNA (adenosine(37)-N6)-threonylcarbamoyltransferase complex transferase subunit TsaD [Salisediminibacterium halotolerans]|uniref:tRNA N6-adenosine threonylcarbamoyltransferase n=1 Tax=Salisediminibacterium halotolerans TaxID=517425 RepID=A0A1H9TBX6_9BACI|nr:tRNA (adenosine(37)-N6)-threonylcarbamoyltransferase complex transferase subunit TsaD [Salisediminibacterium haloalkalitolerans]SER94820.1 N6-L-threonylcarbamoyladenine synthase [Salisediminibacterium haloalkalitolerans]
MKKLEDTMILAIETSCDETAAAVVKNGREVLSNVVASQIDSHKRFGGVVPEVASRHHVEQITLIIEEALAEADITLDDVDAFAVTEGPGLVGALLIGVHAAKGLSLATGKPLIGVHHIAGHIYANHLVDELTFPLISLVVSGGHTELIYMKEHGVYEMLGETRDDAVGEAYDKVARTLGLPYPGGPAIDKLAASGEPAIDLPRSWLEEGSFDFSFSGLKSSVLNTLHNAKQRGTELETADLAASFQASAVEVLVEKTAAAAEAFDVPRVVLAGGVAANSGLRDALTRRMEKDGRKLTIPPLHLCTDNAAMIGAAAMVQYNRGDFAGDDLNGRPGLSLSNND